MAKEKKNYQGVSNVALLLAGRFHRPLQLWQDVSGDEKLAWGGMDELHHGILTASGAEDPRRDRHVNKT